ncbi:4-hydroxy-tetrahydrodipicolinate synthase [Alkalihalobacillus pseudalcaliphilus]|uniref:4-hydroxy-tetrahydrodipicolinate synthase n=1 Tax=Alkalihalobacillus pseudalcaliphilus TaxID=79884 RepID=UPI00064D761A|nr:4-hydroxy-tetrahydrodipicolinate synthase [Alkalihalobacillus pseudalcaliphilus]KMK77269.1 dihydrodipicolinate synthase [Alkalihalobacillus pseudalcaliphilus]
MKFGRLLTAMVTPFQADGQINYRQVEKLIEHLIATGTDALVVNGTTGESPTLTKDEKEKLFDFVVQYVNKRIPVIAGVGSNSTLQSIEAAKKATELGVDGVMAVVPYYNKPSQKGLIQHFTSIARATHLPVMLYNVPPRTVTNLESATVVELSKVENIFAVKEASGSLEQMAEIISGTDEEFIVYCGDDSLTLPALAIGANGVVSVSAHVYGLEMKEMIQAYLKGEHSEAGTLHRYLLPRMKAMFLAPSPTCVKYALMKKGIDVGGVRLPLVEPEPATKQILDQIFQF